MSSNAEVFTALGHDGSLQVMELLSRRGSLSTEEVATALSWEVEYVDLLVEEELLPAGLVLVGDGKVRVCRSKCNQIRHLLEFLTVGPLHVDYVPAASHNDKEVRFVHERPVPAHELLGL